MCQSPQFMFIVVSVQTSYKYQTLGQERTGTILLCPLSKNLKTFRSFKGNESEPPPPPFFYFGRFVGVMSWVLKGTVWFRVNQYPAEFHESSQHLSFTPSLELSMCSVFCCFVFFLRKRSKRGASTRNTLFKSTLIQVILSFYNIKFQHISIVHVSRQVVPLRHTKLGIILKSKTGKEK